MECVLVKEEAVCVQLTLCLVCLILFLSILSSSIITFNFNKRLHVLHIADTSMISETHATNYYVLVP